MAVFRKRSNLLLTIVLVAVFVAIAFGMFSLFKRVDKLEPTKTVSSSAYTRGLLDDTTGKLPRDSEDIDYSGIHMKDYINADGLTCEIAEKAKIRYEINFFDEDYHFISVSKKTTDYAGDENPEGAVFALIEIIPTAEPDGIVSSNEVSKYAKLLTVTYNK